MMAEDAVDDIDMNLDHSEAAAAFAEENTHDIWNQPTENEEESDTPAFLRRRKKNKKHHTED
jgi:hypothetical protein